MKFKVTAVSLLSAILIVCLFTSYKLITEAERQSRLQFVAIQTYLYTMGYSTNQVDNIWNGEIDSRLPTAIKP